MDISKFMTDNSLVIMIVSGIIIMTMIGYLAKEFGFGEKVSKQKTKNVDAGNDNIETLDESIANIDSASEQTSTLDTVNPYFNGEQLIISDVNIGLENSNDETESIEDLYAPFGDQVSEANNMLDNLKIEEVDENPNIDVISEPEQIKMDETIDSQQLGNDINNINNGEIQIEDVETQMPVHDDKQEAIIEEINDLVDKTVVVNVDNKPSVSNNNETQDISNDLEFETTTNLKLDEINETIKNLKLEDLDNPSSEEVLESTTKVKKRKPINVKSVDEIKNGSHTNKTDNNNQLDMHLPSLDDINNSNSETVNETDDIWKF